MRGSRVSAGRSLVADATTTAAARDPLSLSLAPALVVLTFPPPLLLPLSCRDNASADAMCSDRALPLGSRQDKRERETPDAGVSARGERRKREREKWNSPSFARILRPTTRAA